MLNEKKPFDPARLPFYYGYLIVAASTLGILASAPGQTVGVSVFTDHLIAALNLNRLSLGTAYMLGTITSAFLVSGAGWLMDKFGIRLLSAISAVGLSLILIYMSQVDRIANFAYKHISLLITQPMLKPATAFAVVTIGFVFMRFFGQGVLTLASRTMLMEWFVEYRGRMNAIAGLMISMLFAGAPSVFNLLIEAHSWRGAWIIMAVAIGICMTLFILIFFRNTPEGCGLKPDGPLAEKNKHMDSSDQSEGVIINNAQLSQAIRTKEFWIFNLGISMFSLIGTAITFHIVSIFKSGGYERATAISVFQYAVIIAVLVNLIVGYLSDKTRLKYYLWILLVGLITSCCSIFFIDSPLGWWLLVIGNGLGSGTFGTLMSVTWPRFFGRKHLGAISGLCMSFVVFFSAIGPFLFGLSYNFLQSYSASALLCLVVCVIFLITSLHPAVEKIKS